MWPNVGYTPLNVNLGVTTEDNSRDSREVFSPKRRNVREVLVEVPRSVTVVSYQQQIVSVVVK
jgi:hypothetical protein